MYHRLSPPPVLLHSYCKQYHKLELGKPGNEASINSNHEVYYLWKPWCHYSFSGAHKHTRVLYSYHSTLLLSHNGTTGCSQDFTYCFHHLRPVSTVEAVSKVSVCGYPTILWPPFPQHSSSKESHKLFFLITLSMDSYVSLQTIM